jgi:hypothetical protein
MMDLLNRSAAQFGSIGGKVADASPVTDNTERLISGQKEDIGWVERDKQAREKLNQHLMGKLLEQEGQIGAAKMQRSKLEQEQAKAAQDTKFKNRELALKEKELSQKSEMPKELKADQTNAAMFARRVEQAEQDFANVAAKGYDPTGASAGLQRMLPGALTGENSRLQEQAERNFINSILRRESGAAISPSEFQNAEKQYFPRYGDTPEVLAQKKRNRDIVFNGLKVAAGPAFDRVEGVPQTAIAQEKPGSGTAIASEAPQITPDDAKALRWAQQNQNDPRAKQIFDRLKGKGL